MTNQLRMTNCRASVSDAIAFRRNSYNNSCFVIPSEFDIRASSFGNVHPSNAPRIADPFRIEFFADENELSPLRLKWLQFPAARHEIEKLRAIGEADETLRANHARRQAICKAFETIARKNFAGNECERFEFRLMLVVFRRMRFFSRVQFQTTVPDQSCNARCEQLPRSD